MHSRRSLMHVRIRHSVLIGTSLHTSKKTFGRRLF